MTLIWNKYTFENKRFAACVPEVQMVTIWPAAMAQKLLLFQFGILKLRGFFKSSKNEFNLTRCGIFRGKILRRKNQNIKNKTDLK